MSKVEVKADFIKITELWRKLFQNSCSGKKETFTNAPYTFAHFFDTISWVHWTHYTINFQSPHLWPGSHSSLHSHVACYYHHHRFEKLNSPCHLSEPSNCATQPWSLNGGYGREEWENREEQNMPAEKEQQLKWLRTSTSPPSPQHGLGTPALSRGPPAQMPYSHLWLRDWASVAGGTTCQALGDEETRSGSKRKPSLSWNTIEPIPALDFSGKTEFCDCATWGSVKNMLLKPLVLSAPVSRGLCTDQVSCLCTN